MSNLLDFINNDVRSVAVVGHVRPDGDCAGSVMAAYHYLRDNIPDLRVVPFLGELPFGIRFLIENQPVREDEGEGENFDLVISLDASTVERIGAGKQAFLNCGKTVCIDHHATNPGFAGENIILPNASSACEVLYRMLSPDRIDFDTAVCLYTGIIHDTGALRFDNVSPDTLNIVSDLIARGIPFSKIVEKSFTEKSYEEMKITGEIVARSTLFQKERFLVGSCDLKMQQDFGVSATELGGVVAYMNEVREADVVMFMYQFTDGSWKGSLRSKSDVNVAAIAQTFGGGGHIRAAGFSFDQPLEEVTEIVRRQIAEASN